MMKDATDMASIPFISLMWPSEQTWSGRTGGEAFGAPELARATKHYELQFAMAIVALVKANIPARDLFCSPATCGTNDQSALIRRVVRRQADHEVATGRNHDAC